MKRYSAAQARQHLADVLDEAEQGHAVVIERKGVRFKVSVVERDHKRPKRAPLLIVDPAVAAGDWTWSWTPGGGVEFRPGRTKAK